MYQNKTSTQMLVIVNILIKKDIQIKYGKFLSCAFFSDDYTHKNNQYYYTEK